MTREEALAFRQKEFEEALGFDHAPESTEFEDSMDSLDLLYGNDPLKEDQYLVGGVFRLGYTNIPERLILWTIKEPYYEKMLTVSSGNYWKIYQQFNEDPYRGSYVNLYATMISSAWNVPWENNFWDDEEYIREDDCEQQMFLKGFLRAVIPDIPYLVDPSPVIPEIPAYIRPRIQYILTPEKSCIIIKEDEGRQEVELELDFDCFEEEWLRKMSSITVNSGAKVLIWGSDGSIGWASVTEC